MKITQNLSARTPFNSLFMIQNTLWSSDYNITPLHGERERERERERGNEMILKKTTSVQ
jgi:hypothetical protein